MTATRKHRPVISDGLPSQLPDTDPDETSEWVESLRGMVEAQGQ
jgi:pyruvate dehydrogenase E1 component